MALLVLAGLNVAMFQLTAYRSLPRWDRAPSAPAIGRAVAVISLAIWVGAIFAGRMIGFTTTRRASEPTPADINFEELLGLPSSPASAPEAPPPTK
jgi:hypothetical protein